MVLEAELPDTSSEFAAEGTAAHELAAMALTSGQDTDAYLGLVIEVEGRTFDVDHTMAEEVQKYVDLVRSLADGADDLLVEQRLSIAWLTGEEDAAGTSDAVILHGDEIIVVDLKYGRGVQVDAQHNEQLQIYALAALEEYSLLGDFKRARMVISQPRLNHVSEWDCTVEELRFFAEEVADSARATKGPTTLLMPGDKQCRFCKAKATCPSLANQVLTVVADDFVDTSKEIEPQLASAMTRLDSSDNAHLANCLQAVDLIETWCKAVRAKAEAELFAGHEVPGFKLVEGRKGHRKWVDEQQVEAALKSMRLKDEQMYDFKLISPTTAEKLHKAGTIGPRQWPKLQGLIVQSEGSPSVAPASDKRPALVIAATEDDFQDVAAQDNVEDLV